MDVKENYINNLHRKYHKTKMEDPLKRPDQRSLADLPGTVDYDRLPLEQRLLDCILNGSPDYINTHFYYNMVITIAIIMII